MDFTPIITQVRGPLGWLILLILLIGLLKSSWAKGHIGELLVRLFAYWQLDRQSYLRLHNVTLNTPDGTTQIDHVFLSPYGIFVLETKNMSGWIFGSEQQAQWTQKLYKHSFKFQNPLRQNYKHLKALETTLGVAPEHMHSVITFVGNSTFKTEMPVNVTEGIGFIRYIKSFQEPVFSEAEIHALLQTLQSGRRAPTQATHREHVQNLKRRSDPTAERQCPKCGSALVIRVRKTGTNAGQQFWGCSTFPKCRTMQSL
ncbi:NERD domain-containing protein [Pseudomonas sp. CCI3.2]|uniref:nuclease-related domain-containing protein n=1 Tax=unclassified Pseudomonas TaxID=196821 RepID=UPI002AC949F0|nr:MULTISPECIES: NERD domain-containing protein [unclassified Pseudomonas]MEB0079406.1 NERD domain-containing protein [Pseudomonas sp. MH10out]MEB0103760.1 NERD domain-containing protein [Pseudomonas sp. CCI3.2]MEB0132395.1 NERD domain-containing protein [Pseudomonas sp. CCI2.4]MEB0159677.1 NERD domain-containing protein [Pseudomonas sp. AH2 (2023)]MEB0169115.1 NERD domain-containing protein [Pseudomonas sp. CCC4.4]